MAGIPITLRIFHRLGEQDGGGVGGCGIPLSPWIHQECRSACRTITDSRQEYLASGEKNT